MDTYLAQDWITLVGSSIGGSAVTQSELAWLDFAAYRDVVAWLDVKRASTSGITMSYQSAVARQESLFATMAQVSPLAGASLIVTPMLQDLQTGGATAAPLARFFRWSLNIPASAEIVFRLWVAANKPGRAAMNRAATTRR